MSAVKSLEEFQQMQVSQLKGILTGLDVAIPKLDFRKSENQTKLAQLAYDTQQPLPDDNAGDETPPDTVVEPDDKKDGDIPVEEEMERIAEFFGGKVIPSGEQDDGVVIFAVVSKEGNVIKEGSFLDLVDEVNTVQTQENAAADELSVEPDPVPEAVVDTDTVETTTSSKDIKDRLKPLIGLGLKVTVTPDSVKMSFGSKSQTTTVHQPVHRIVRAAEHMVRVR